jgi:hypothetical protein
MRKIISYFLLLTVSSIVSVGQPFEGKITYQNTYKSKMPTVTDALFTQMMGPVQEFSIKDGNYRSSTNGTLLLWQVYIRKDNKLYTKFSSSPSVLWNDGAVNPDSVIKSELNKNVVEILGYKCDEIILTCKTGIQKYYFNSKIGVDPKLFEKHKFGNWYDYLVLAKSLPLKMVIETPQFSLEGVATSIQPQKMDSQLFTLPADAKLEKSPF